MQLRAQYSGNSEIRPPMGLLQIGLDCEVVSFWRLLNIENAVLILKWS